MYWFRGKGGDPCWWHEGIGDEPSSVTALWKQIFTKYPAQAVLSSCCCCWVTKSCPTLCDLRDCSTPDPSAIHYLPEFAQTHVHWIGDTIQPSHPLSSPLLPQSFPASGSFPLSQLFTSGGQSIGAPASASVLPVNSQGWFLLGLTALLSLHSKGRARVFSSTTIRKHQFFGTHPSLWSNSHLRTWLPAKP